MKRYLFLPIISLLLVFISGCREDDLFLSSNDGLKGLPVELEVVLPDDVDTRGVVDESKTSFQIGELIHVRGVFNCMTSNGREYQEIQYGVMKYAGQGRWNALDTQHSLYWPGESVSASFTAYYLYGSTGALTSNFMAPTLLSNYNYGEDPLYAQSLNVRYGHAIRLEMEHIFTHFTLSEMSSGIAEELWFTIPETSTADSPLNNAFYLAFNESTYEMTPVYTQIASDSYKDSEGNPLVYISGSAEQYVTDEGEVMSRVSYFMQPGVYHQFALRYPRSRTEAPVYLSYTRDLSQIISYFSANGRYDFSILKSLGVVVDQTPDNSWDKSDPTYIIDVEKFLRAANSGTDYWEEDPETGEMVQILEQTPTGTRLLVNADFHFMQYVTFGADNFEPSISNTFDGNYHYIYNVGCPLFYGNYEGTICNLGIRNAKAQNLESNELYPYNGGQYNTSYHGLFTRINRGIVSNVRLIEAEMTVNIRTSREEASQEAHNAALLFGVNYGNVYDVNLGGTLTLNLQNAEGETIVPNVVAGGITAQNFGTISEVSSINEDDIDTPQVKIFNYCNGVNGVYLMGGISGNSTGKLYNVFIESLMLDGSGSSGVESRLGGLVGELGLSYTGASHTDGCIVRGEVIAGYVNPLTNVASFAYTGGVAGSVNTQAIVTNCSASVGVTGSPNYASTVNYGTGGAFGRIENTVGFIDGSLQNLACYGSKLSGQVYVGNFAGVAPLNYTWEDLYINNDINVKQYSGRQNIGANL